MVSCERGEAVEIARADARNRHLDGLAPCRTKLAEQATQGPGREFVPMRMREYDARARVTESGDGLGERRPLDRRMPWATSDQPTREGITDVFGVTRSHQLTRKVHASRDGVAGENLCCQSLARQARFVLETLADFGDPRRTSYANVHKMSAERGILEIELEPDHVQGLPVPATGHFDAGHMLQALVCTGDACLATALEGVVIGQRRMGHAAARA